jgi:hypothetical protein
MTWPATGTGDTSWNEDLISEPEATVCLTDRSLLLIISVPRHLALFLVTKDAKKKENSGRSVSISKCNRPSLPARLALQLTYIAYSINWH